MMIWFLPLFLLGLFCLISVINALTFPRLRKQHSECAPFVSIILPARNEAHIIAETVKRLLEQDYPAFQVILLDDQSGDGTAQIARNAAREDERFQVLIGEPLPEGWQGKSWACHQASQAAQGEWLVFTDADVRWQPGALTAIVSCALRTKADLLTVWPTQIMKSWAERLVVPMMTFIVLAYLPELAVRFISWPVFTAANGQCLVFRRSVYDQIGGHFAVRSKVLDDMSLALNTKKVGRRLVQALGTGYLMTRMYTNWASVKAGFAKNILAGHGGQVFFLLLSAVFHWSLFLLPWLWLALGWILPWQENFWPFVPLLLVGMGLAIRLVSAAIMHERLGDAFLLPVSVIMMTIIAAQALIWYWRGSASWKGRVIANHQ